MLKSPLEALVFGADAEIREKPRDRIGGVPVGQGRVVAAGIGAEMIGFAADDAQQNVPEALLIQRRAGEARVLGHFPALGFSQPWRRDARHDLIYGVDDDAARRPATL